MIFDLSLRSGCIFRNHQFKFIYRIAQAGMLIATTGIFMTTAVEMFARQCFVRNIPFGSKGKFNDSILIRDQACDLHLLQRQQIIDNSFGISRDIANLL